MEEEKHICDQQGFINENNDLRIPITHRDVLYEIPLKEIEQTRGKKSIIRQYVQELPYQPWTFCKQYQYGSCLFGEDCWNVHVNPIYWKSISFNNNNKAEKNCDRAQDLFGLKLTKELEKKMLFISVKIMDEKTNKYNLHKIPTEVIVPTVTFINLKEKYEKNNDNHKNNIMGTWCFMYQQSSCKFGDQCKKIHIRPWFINQLYKENIL